MKRPIVFVAILVVAAVAGGAAWYSKHKPAAHAEASGNTVFVPVSVREVTISRMVNRVTSYGNLVPQRTVNIVPNEPGQLTKILFKDGQAVETGTPLAVMDNRIAQAQVQSSQAQYDADVLNLKRTKSLANRSLTDALARAGPVARGGLAVGPADQPAQARPAHAACAVPGHAGRAQRRRGRLPQHRPDDRAPRRHVPVRDRVPDARLGRAADEGWHADSRAPARQGGRSRQRRQAVVHRPRRLDQFAFGAAARPGAEQAGPASTRPVRPRPNSISMPTTTRWSCR